QLLLRLQLHLHPLNLHPPSTRAIQLGYVEGSMSGAAIALAGVVTAMTAPIVVHFLIRLF
ncbi:MAG TPA: LrgB family protein, partial [Bacillota bacterium]|nr:LrgB family protein [Bacillota bacterium]